jgi:hypothetical protein
VYPWPKSKSLEARGKLASKGLQRSGYRVPLAKFCLLTQPTDVQILSNASCTSDSTSSVITRVLLPMYTVLYALFPWGFLTRPETWQLMSQRQYYYGMLIADTAGHCTWWRQVTSFGVESGALLWSARTHRHTPSWGYSNRVVQYAWCSSVRCVLLFGDVIGRSGT